jgi:hypothetical protein
MNLEQTIYVSCATYSGIFPNRAAGFRRDNIGEGQYPKQTLHETISCVCNWVWVG